MGARRPAAEDGDELESAGYAEILALDPGDEPLDLTPPAARSRLAADGPGMGRARGRLRER